MTARSGMTNLIDILRGMTDCGSADYTIGTASYWTDDQLQQILDIHRLNIWREPLQIIETYPGGGSTYYKNYQSLYGNYEETTGGTDVFIIEDGAGNDITVGFTPDYNTGAITFTDDTTGTVYYLTGRSYDLNASAADIWRRKAAHYGASFSFSTDNHRVDKGALVDNALKMARIYAGFVPPSSSTLYRSDVDDAALDI